MTPRVITVMLGGPSAEREVSLRSGAAVAASLRRSGHTVHELDPVLSVADDYDVVFVVDHDVGGDGGGPRVRYDVLCPHQTPAAA